MLPPIPVAYRPWYILIVENGEGEVKKLVRTQNAREYVEEFEKSVGEFATQQAGRKS